MDTNRLTYLYNHPHKATESDLKQLNEVMVAFPYSASLHMVFAKIMQQQNSYQFQDVLRKAALYAPDRAVLENYIEGDDTGKKTEDGKRKTEEPATSHQKPATSNQSTVHSPQSTDEKEDRGRETEVEETDTRETSTAHSPQSTDEEGGQKTGEKTEDGRRKTEEPVTIDQSTVHSPQSTDETEDRKQGTEQPVTNDQPPATSDHSDNPDIYRGGSHQKPLKEGELNLEHLPERVRNLILKSREVRQKVEETRKAEGLEKAGSAERRERPEKQIVEPELKSQDYTPKPQKPAENIEKEKPEPVSENFEEPVFELEANDSSMEEKEIEDKKPEITVSASIPEKEEPEERAVTFEILDETEPEKHENQPPVSVNEVSETETEEVPDFLTWLKRTKKTEDGGRKTEDENQKKDEHATHNPPPDSSDKHELIDRFIQKQPNFKPRRNENTSINMAELSFVDESAYVTETLARIYAEQKHYDKAINAYEILRLKYPEKSSFFADRILEIKKLKQNR